MLIRDGEVTAGIEQLRRALQAGGAFGAGYYSLAGAYRKLGDEHKATENFALAERYANVQVPRPDRLMARMKVLNIGDRALIARAQALEAAGRTDEAIAALERAVERDPADAAARATLVAMYARVGTLPRWTRNTRPRCV